MKILDNCMRKKRIVFGGAAHHNEFSVSRLEKFRTERVLVALYEIAHSHRWCGQNVDGLNVE